MNEVDARSLLGVLDPVPTGLRVRPVSVVLGGGVLRDERVALRSGTGDDGEVVDHAVSAAILVVGDDIARLGASSSVVTPLQLGDRRHASVVDEVVLQVVRPGGRSGV